MSDELTRFLKLLKITKPDKYEILKNNDVEKIYGKLKSWQQRRAFLMLLILLTMPDYRKKFLDRG